MVNPTYKHLEAKLRVGPLTLWQWAQLFLAVVAALAFGIYLSPLPIAPTISLSVFVGGLPIALSYAAMGLDFSVLEFAHGALSWWRSERRYLPGPGTATDRTGYVVTRDEEAEPPPAAPQPPSELSELWEL